MRFSRSIHAILAVAVLLVGAGDLFAQAEPPALLITQSGHYFVVLDSDGEPTLVKITQVIDMTGGGGPVPPDDPTPPKPPTVTVQVAELTKSVNHPVGAQALSLTYGTIADSLRDGKLSYENTLPALKQASDTVLTAVKAGDKWVGWRASVGDILTAKMQSGDVTNARELEKFLREVKAGLDSAAGTEAALDPATLQLIITLILQVIERLFGGAGVGPL